MMEEVSRELLPSDSIKIDGQEIMIPKQIIIINDKPDSVTIKQSAKGDLYFELKVYSNLGVDWSKELDRIFKIKEDIERRLHPKEPEIA